MEWSPKASCARAALQNQRLPGCGLRPRPPCHSSSHSRWVPALACAPGLGWRGSGGSWPASGLKPTPLLLPCGASSCRARSVWRQRRGCRWCPSRCVAPATSCPTRASTCCSPAKSRHARPPTGRFGVQRTLRAWLRCHVFRRTCTCRTRAGILACGCLLRPAPAPCAQVIIHPSIPPQSADAMADQAQREIASGLPPQLLMPEVAAAIAAPPKEGGGPTASTASMGSID